MLVAWQTLQARAQEPSSVLKVERFAAVAVDPASFPQPKDHQALSTLIPPLQKPDFTRVESQEEARQLTGYELRRPTLLPQGVDPSPRWAVLPAASFTYTVDSAKWESFCQALGRGGVALPPTLEGTTLTFDMPGAAVAIFGGDRPTLTLGQGKSPTLTFPPEVDVEALREALLGLPIVPPDVAGQLRAIDNWKGTMVVPLPPKATSREVKVDGVTGLLISGEDEKAALVLWQKNGILYGLFGTVAEADLLAAADSLK